MLVVPAMVLAMSGCSGDDEGDTDATTSDGASDTATPDGSETPTAITTSPPDLEPLPTVRQAEGAVADLEFDLSTCETAAGEQTFSGTLTNPTDQATGYLVAISWTNATSDTLGRGVAVVRGAKPGVETEWTVTAEVPEGATQCVPFAQRGVIKK